MPHLKLDIVLPCYNPLDGWEVNIIASLTRLQLFLPQVEFYLYLVNDGSTKKIDDRAIETLKRTITNFNYINYPENRGKGYALRQGVMQTKNQLCIYTDIDFPYTEESFAAIYNILSNENNDIVVGVRDNSYYANVPPARVRISKTLRLFSKKLLSLPVNDTQAGLKGFNRKGREIFLKTTIDRYLFDLEFLFSAAKESGLQIKPVRVTLKPGIVFSKMNSRILITEGYSFFKLFLSVPFLNVFKKH